MVSWESETRKLGAGSGAVAPPPTGLQVQDPLSEGHSVLPEGALGTAEHCSPLSPPGSVLSHLRQVRVWKAGHHR